MSKKYIVLCKSKTGVTQAINASDLEDAHKLKAKHDKGKTLNKATIVEVKPRMGRPKKK